MTEYCVEYVEKIGKSISRGRDGALFVPRIEKEIAERYAVHIFKSQFSGHITVVFGSSSKRKEQRVLRVRLVDRRIP